MNKETNSPRTKSPTESPILEDTLISSASPDFLFDAIKSMPFFEDGRMAFLRKGISIPTILDLAGGDHTLSSISIDYYPGSHDRCYFSVEDNNKYLEECRQKGVLPFSTFSFNKGQLQIHYPYGHILWKEHPYDIVCRGGAPHAILVQYRFCSSDVQGNLHNCLESVCEKIHDLDEKGYFVCDGCFKLPRMGYPGSDRTRMYFDRKGQTINLDIFPEKYFEYIINSKEEKMFSSWVRNLKERYGSCNKGGA